MIVFCTFHVRALDGSLTYWLTGVSQSREGARYLARIHFFASPTYELKIHHMCRGDNRGFEVKDGDYLIEETELQP